jgi:hypothetical protein
LEAATAQVAMKLLTLTCCRLHGTAMDQGPPPELDGLLTERMGYELDVRKARFSTEPTKVRPQTEKTQLA